MDALLAFLSHDASGLAIAAIVVAVGAMLWRASRRPGRRALAIASWAVLAVGAVLAAGAAYHVAYAAQVRKQHPPPGRLVDVGGHRIHLLAEGEAKGRPPIVWIPGAHSGGFAFYHLHAKLRGEARSILIDRPGSGWSDAGPFPRTTPREAEEVVAALAAAGEKGPFVFAGHSFGGLLAANIARRHPELTAAVVLIDATPPDAINYCPPNPYLDDMQRSATIATLQRAFGLHADLARRLFAKPLPPEWQKVTHIIEDQLGDAGRTMQAVEDTPRAMAANRSSFEELKRGGLGWDEMVYDGDLEGLPVYLVAPPRMAEFNVVASSLLPDPKAREQQRLLRFYEATRERYLATSKKSVRVYAPDGSSHNFPYEHPQFMVDTLRRVLADVAAPPAGTAPPPGTEVAPGAAAPATATAPRAATK